MHSDTSIHNQAQVRTELAELASGYGDPGKALAGLAVAVLKDGKVRFEAAFGHAYIDPQGGPGRPLAPDSLIRVASISKTLSAVVVMQLVDEGLLALDRDVSDYLGWPLRNPHYPDRPITLTHLLAHTSSIRDAGESYIIRYPRALQEAFDPTAPEFSERFQDAAGEDDRGPGEFYEYTNLNFGVIGSILEKVTGQRFDELMRERFYEPLGLAGGYNVAVFSSAERESLATLYRKRGADGAWHQEGQWVPQVDDLTQGIPTALPADAHYEPGTNGAQFSPQGGARLSLRGLEALALLLMGDGRVDGVQILSPERTAQLRQPAWQYDASLGNIDHYDGTLNARTAGLRIISGKTPGDRLFTGDERRWFGHFGEAYGLLAGVWVQPEAGEAVIYAITGTAFDPYAEPHGDKVAQPIEAAVLAALSKL